MTYCTRIILRAYHASVHGGLSANGLSYICLRFFYGNDSIELLEIMFDGRAFHSLAVVGRKKDFRMCWTSV